MCQVRGEGARAIERKKKKSNRSRRRGGEDYASHNMLTHSYSAAELDIDACSACDSDSLLCCIARRTVSSLSIERTNEREDRKPPPHVRKARVSKACALPCCCSRDDGEGKLEMIFSFEHLRSGEATSANEDGTMSLQRACVAACLARRVGSFFIFYMKLMHCSRTSPARPAVAKMRGKETFTFTAALREEQRERREETERREQRERGKRRER